MQDLSVVDKFVPMSNNTSVTWQTLLSNANRIVQVTPATVRIQTPVSRMDAAILPLHHQAYHTNSSLSDEEQSGLIILL